MRIDEYERPEGAGKFHWEDLDGCWGPKCGQKAFERRGAGTTIRAPHPLFYPHG